MFPVLEDLNSYFEIQKINSLKPRFVRAIIKDIKRNITDDFKLLRLVD